MYPSHEMLIKKIAVAHGGFELVTMSSDLSPMIRMVPRGIYSVYVVYTLCVVYVNCMYSICVVYVYRVCGLYM